MLNETNQVSSLSCGFGISPWLHLHIFLLCMSGVYEFLDFLCPLGAGLLIVLCFFPILHWPRHFVSAHISSLATNELPHQLTVRFYSSLLFLFLNSRSHITCILHYDTLCIGSESYSYNNFLFENTCTHLNEDTCWHNAFCRTLILSITHQHLIINRTVTLKPNLNRKTAV